MLTYLPFFSFKCCGSVVLYILVLEVARELSRFCKMARRSKMLRPCCSTYQIHWENWWWEFSV